MLQKNDIYVLTASFCEKGRIFYESEKIMGKRIAVVGIILEENESAAEVNRILHENSEIIVGRMGLPYRERKCSVISIIVDAEADRISALTGKLGRLNGVSVKAAISKE